MEAVSLANWRAVLLTSLGVASFVGCGGAASGDTAGGGSGTLQGGMDTGGAARLTGGTAAGGTAAGGTAAGGTAAGGEGLAGGFNPTGGGNGAGSPSTNAGSGGGGLRPCENPTPLAPSAPNAQPGSGAPVVDTGFVQCEGGWLHRAAIHECSSFLPRDTQIDVTGTLSPECSRDSDCPGRFAHCERTGGFGRAPTVTCNSGCVADSDCGPEGVCLCGYPVGTCASATCKSDADCGTGLCVGTRSASVVCGDNFTAFSCQGAQDSCLSGSECLVSGGACLTIDSVRSCVSIGVCGRPFLVAGKPRLAEPRAGSSWAARCAPALSDLDSPSRQRLARHFTQIALMEHASIAAFARFTLELLALGAPAELLHEAQRALRDEIQHTELCFGLASAYEGRTLEAGPLAIAGSLDHRSTVEIFRTAFLEACIGETVAAVEAHSALARVEDDAVRSVLSRIAEDEARHAELGFRFVKWLLETQPPEVSRTLARELEALLAAELAAETDDAAASLVSEQLAAHGLLGASARAEARRAALHELCVPCVAALLRSTGSAQGIPAERSSWA